MWRVGFLPQMEESFAYLPFIVLPFIQRLQWPVKAAGCFDGFSNLAIYTRYHTRDPRGLGLWLGGRAAWSLQSTSELTLAKTSASWSHKKMWFKGFFTLKLDLPSKIWVFCHIPSLMTWWIGYFLFYSFFILKIFFQWYISKVKIALKHLFWNTPFILLF